MNIWSPIDRLIGCDSSADLESTLRARLAFAFSAMLGIMTAINTGLLAIAGDARPGMIWVGVAACLLALGSGWVGVLLRRPAVTMWLIAVFSILIYAAGVAGNRGAIPPAAAYLPCVLLGFYQFWGPRILWVGLPAVGAFFTAVFVLAARYDQPVVYPLNALGFAFGFACIWLICLASVFRSVQQMAATRLQAANESLTMALDDSRAAQRAKSEFLANVGHEVRTPLNGVLGMADVMHRVGGLSPDQAERLDLIRESGGTLLELLNEILDQSKIETGRIVAERVDFDLGKLIEKTASSWRPDAESRGLDLHLDLKALQQPVLLGDPLRIRQILNNLISNALKFTKSGHVALSAHQGPGETDNIWRTTIEVSDTGTGIPADKLDAIFEAFHQADASITRRYGGTGLGLSISRQLARLMDGELAVTSSPGDGSCFRLDLPLPVGELAPEDATLSRVAAVMPEMPNSKQPIRILSVDDVATNHIVLRALLEQVLGNTPLSVVQANSGAEAIAAVNDNEFDLIFMDIQMPEMDGATATRRIREARAGKTAWIVAVSALEAAQRASLLPAGLFQNVLPKPTSLDALQTVLMDWQHGRSANESPPRSQPLAR